MKNFLVGSGLLLVLVAATAWFWWPPQYEVYALLRVAERPSGVLATKSESPEDYAIFKRTQVQLMLSPVVIRRTVGEPEINKLSAIQQHQKDPFSWLKSQLIIDYPDDAEIMRVALRGPKHPELKKIVDMVVKKYLSEVVQHEREVRLQHEASLMARYEQYQNELSRQSEVLHQMQVVAKSDSTEPARFKKQLAIEDLQDALANRREIQRQIRDTALRITLEKSRSEKAVRTTAPSEAPAGLTLHQLEKQKEFLDQELEAANKAIAERSDVFERMESFSAAVASKQEDVKALKEITNQLRSEIERAKVERLAMDRISKVDEATLDSATGDTARRNVTTAILAAIGAMLVGIGLAVRPRTA